jgi:hypothetical protein
LQMPCMSKRRIRHILVSIARRLISAWAAIARARGTAQYAIESSHALLEYSAGSAE